MNREQYLEHGKLICDKLVSDHPIETVTRHHEGRKNAEETEKKWLQRVKKEFTFKDKQVRVFIPKKDDRFWLDFSFTYNGEFFPVNFKSGAGRTADNISGLKYLRYMIFYDLDSDYNIKQPASHLDFSKRVVLLLKGEEPFDEHNRDYFCLSHCTDDDSVRVLPIGCVKNSDLKTNPSNLFQVNFHNARTTNRTLREMVHFIISKYVEYQKKKSAYHVFKEEGFSVKSIPQITG